MTDTISSRFVFLLARLLGRDKGIPFTTESGNLEAKSSWNWLIPSHVSRFFVPSYVVLVALLAVQTSFKRSQIY